MNELAFAIMASASLVIILVRAFFFRKEMEGIHYVLPLLSTASAFIVQSICWGSVSQNKCGENEGMVDGCIGK